MNQAENSDLKLHFVNSLCTHEEARSALAKIKSPITPESFIQNNYPKVHQKNMRGPPGQQLLH
jgi:hypothetical protein